MRAALAAGFALLASAAHAEPAMWRYRDADTTVTILGSIHALPPDLVWRGPAVDRAIADADLVVFEMRQDPTPDVSRAASDLMARLGRATDGVALSSRLSAEGRARLARHATEASIPPVELETLQPWYAAFRLEWAGDARAGGEVRLGVESQVAAALRPDQRRDALEEPPDVVRILSGYPMAEQVRLLEGLLIALDDPELMRRDARALERAWAEGSLAAVQGESARLQTASPTVHAQLVSDRNRRWAERLAGLLDTPGEVLVVVGAGHLVGDQGVPALLRARGVRVEGPS